MRGAALVIALLLSLIGADPAWACRGPFRSLPENYSSAKVVFRGKVTEVREVGPAPSFPHSKSLQISLSVEQTYKGTLDKTVMIRGDTTTCGFGGSLEPGDRVVIFAGGEPLGTSAVSGSFVLRGGPEDAQRLAQLESVAAGKK